MGRAFVRGLNDGPSNIEVEYEPPCDGLREHFSRTDNCGKLDRWQKLLKPERVPCPFAGCECTYEMYGYRPSNLEDNVATLQERLKREHPDHTSEVLAVNEFRKVPR